MVDEIGDTLEKRPSNIVDFPGVRNQGWQGSFVSGEKSIIKPPLINALANTPAVLDKFGEVLHQVQGDGYMDGFYGTYFSDPNIEATDSAIEEQADRLLNVYPSWRQTVLGDLDDSDPAKPTFQDLVAYPARKLAKIEKAARRGSRRSDVKMWESSITFWKTRDRFAKRALEKGKEPFEFKVPPPPASGK